MGDGRSSLWIQIYPCFMFPSPDAGLAAVPDPPPLHKPRTSYGLHSLCSQEQPPLLAAGAWGISVWCYISWLLSLPPACCCCCFLRQFLKGGSVPRGWPEHSQEWYYCLDGKMPCPGGMGTAPQHKDTWKAVGPGFFSFVWCFSMSYTKLYIQHGWTYPVVRCLALSCCPKSPILLLFPVTGQQGLLSGFALGSWASEIWMHVFSPLPSPLLSRLSWIALVTDCTSGSQAFMPLSLLFSQDDFIPPPVLRCLCFAITELQAEPGSLRQWLWVTK